MEFLLHAIANDQVVMSCPNCKRGNFQASGLGGGLLHCNHCYTHTHPTEWVIEIKRCGDDDPNVHLRIVRSDNGFIVQANTDRRGLREIESVRFAGSGGHSYSTKAALRTVAYAGSPSDVPRIQFQGRGGNLKIFGGIGDDDMWVKTEDFERRLFHGAEVHFSFEDQAATPIRSLIASLLRDMEERPLSGLKFV